MTDINNRIPMSGRIIGEDNEIYNLVDLLRNSGGGGSSMAFHFGSGAPADDLGESEDVYMNTDNGDFYKNENGTWNLKGNLQGPQGPPGEQGPTGADGADGTNGSDGVSVTGATSDGTNINFELSDGTTIPVPWPEQ